MVLQRHKRESGGHDRRLWFLKAAFVIFAFLLLARLFFLQIIKHDYYAAMAGGKYSVYRELLPVRGRIFLSDFKQTDKPAPLAVNRDTFFVVVDPKVVVDANRAANLLAKKLGLDELSVAVKVKKTGSRYEIIKKQVSAEVVEELKLEGLAGVFFERQPARFYPEKTMGSQVVGFLGLDKNSFPVGNYGVEGYFEELLRGQYGYMVGEKGATGNWLSLGKRESRPAVDGADLILTIDKTIEYVACQKIKEGVVEYGAKSGVVVIINPKTGAVLAMCGWPSFDPNEYSKEKNLNIFNNAAIFTPYEPGSVFKAVTMAGALDAGKVTPETKYLDKGFVQLGGYTIKNAADKKYGEQIMTNVLKESINTGAVFAARLLGHQLFKKYAEDFGFGVLSGVELDTEAPGNISSLEKEKEIYLATASFGQGIMVTPLQLAMAFGAIANGGKLYKPQIVLEIRYADGRVEKREPHLARQVISERSARLLAGMLTTVVREGHGKKADVPGYYIAGKTGTAEIAAPGGYLESASNQTFAGFGPVDDPVFVMVVKYEEPQRRFAEYSAAPTFGAIAKFLLQYLEVEPNK